MISLPRSHRPIALWKSENLHIASLYSLVSLHFWFVANLPTFAGIYATIWPGSQTLVGIRQWEHRERQWCVRSSRALPKTLDPSSAVSVPSILLTKTYAPVRIRTLSIKYANHGITCLGLSIVDRIARFAPPDRSMPSPRPHRLLSFPESDHTEQLSKFTNI